MDSPEAAEFLAQVSWQGIPQDLTKPPEVEKILAVGSNQKVAGHMISSLLRHVEVESCAGIQRAQVASFLATEALNPSNALPNPRMLVNLLLG